MKANCPSCQTSFNVPEDYVGKKARCKKCNTYFRIEKSVPSDISETSEKETVDAKISSDSDSVGSSLVNPAKKFLNLADKVLRFAFSLANGVSAFVIFICMVVISFLLLSFLLIFITPVSQDKPPQMQLPSFQQYLSEFENQKKNINEKKSSLKDNSPNTYELAINFVEKKSENLLNKICRNYSLNRRTLEEWLLFYLEDDKVIFLNGLNDFLADAENYFVSKGVRRETIVFMNGAIYYKNAFDYSKKWHDELVLEVKERNKAKIKQKQDLLYFSFLGFSISLGTLLVFLLLPLLIQIEKNTRAFKQFINQEEA